MCEGFGKLALVWNWRLDLISAYTELADNMLDKKYLFVVLKKGVIRLL